MTKTELKSIIKECLLEILSEGLGNTVNESSARKKQAEIEQRKKQEALMQERKRAISDSIKFVAGGDDVMSEILAHTAKTTFKEQMANEQRPRGIIAESSDDESFGSVPGDPGLDITSIFGAASKSWADAAFGAKKKVG